MSTKDSQIEAIKDAKKAGEFDKAVALIDAMKKAGTLTPDEVKKLKAQVRSAKAKVKAVKPEEKKTEEVPAESPDTEEVKEEEEPDADAEEEEPTEEEEVKAEEEPTAEELSTEEEVKEIATLCEDGKFDEALEKAEKLPEDSEGMKLAKESIIGIINDAKDKTEKDKEHIEVPAETIAAVDHAIKNRFYEKLPRLVAYLPEDHPYKAKVLGEHAKMYDTVRNKAAKDQKAAEKKKANEPQLTTDDLNDAYMKLFNMFNKYENQQREAGKAFFHVVASKNRIKIHMSAFKRSC